MPEGWEGEKVGENAEVGMRNSEIKKKMIVRLGH
jgi:hypothetical protein